MPLTYRIDAARRVAVTQVTGRVTIDQIRRHATAMRYEPTFGPDIRELVVFTGVHSEITTAEWIAFSPWWNTLPPLDRTAILAVTDLEFGLARMFEMGGAREGANLRVFRDREQALAWLEVKPEDIEAG